MHRLFIPVAVLDMNLSCLNSFYDSLNVFTMFVWLYEPRGATLHKLEKLQQVFAVSLLHFQFFSSEQQTAIAD